MRLSLSLTFAPVELFRRCSRVCCSEVCVRSSLASRLYWPADATYRLRVEEKRHTAGKAPAAVYTNYIIIELHTQNTTHTHTVHPVLSISGLGVTE